MALYKGKCPQHERNTQCPRSTFHSPASYHTWLSDIVDSAEEYESEARAEDVNDDLPAALMLNDVEMAEKIFDAMDYSAAYLHVANVYLESFDAWAGEALGETRPAWRTVYFTGGGQRRERYRADSCGFTWAAMESPREYNFETDRLFVNASAAFCKRLFAMSKADDHATLARVIADRFTPCSGFAPFYSADLGAWLAKPLADWDHNELGTLLIACLELCNADEDSLMYDVIEGETGFHALEMGMDFDKLQASINAALVEKLYNVATDDPDEAATIKAEFPEVFARIVARDPDMFEGVSQ
ncbi:hypothetical protein GQE99_06590 [Maritimibacter sp. DP07]|uniref:Uncharacterized protein n=1 Tax=Maritimibacter harenae TaxID=2606218 RepID=A0A845M4Q2_9RHOB|nr:hypothetical protein [Maritimibacter harenae]MZR12687.1 hypothetical protein [Maritimibacter harenae]